MRRKYGRAARAGILVAAIPLIVGIVFLFLPAHYGGWNCGNVVMPKHKSPAGITNSDKQLDVKVHNAGCADERTYNMEVALFCGGGGLLGIVLILSMAGSAGPVPVSWR